MLFCTECGANMPDGVRVCTYCGKTMAGPSGSVGAQPVQQQVYTHPTPPIQSTPPPVYAPVPVYSQPASALQPPNEQYAVVSTLSWVGSLILLGIPLVGFIVCLVWAFGGGNHNKRNFARACLILMIACIVLCIVLSVLFFSVFSGIAQQIQGGSVSMLSPLNLVR